MRRRRSLPFRIVASVLLTSPLWLTACGGGEGGGSVVTPPPPPPPVTTTSVALTPQTVALGAVGSTASLTATVNTSAGVAAAPAVTWTSSAPSVATVSGAGTTATVTAVGPGTAQITASSGGQSGSATVTVTPPVTVTAVSVAPATLSLTGIGVTGQLTATVTTSAGVAASPTVTWTSSNPSIATVAGTGATATVTSVAPGAAQITATAGGQSGVAAVTVTPPPQSLTVTLAGEGTGTVTSSPAGLACTGTTCTGSFPFGTTVTLTAAPASGSALDAWSGACAGTTACAVTMGQAQAITARFRRLPVTVATVVIEPTVVNVDEGAATLLVATLRDAAGNVLTGRPITWRSSDTTIATVGPNGVVTGRVEGDTVRITAQVDSVVGTARVLVRSLFFRATSVSSGDEFTCAIRVIGGAFCWGRSSGGQLGNITPVGGGPRNPVTDGGGFVSIAAGSATACALDAAGSAWCWGDGDVGQLGEGVVRPSVATPRRVAGGLLFTSIHLDRSRSCAIAASGAASCWGLNSFSVLGVGTTAERILQPTPVTGGHRFRAIDIGQWHLCGLEFDGRILCWGDPTGTSGRGAIGDGAGRSRPAPTPVSATVSYLAVATGSEHSCGVDSEGAAWCWGSNTSGQLGTGSQSNFAPERVQTTVRFTAITAGQAFTCALSTNGEVFCWGRGNEGQIGNGTETSSLLPVRADAGATRFTSVAAGGPTPARSPRIDGSSAGEPTGRVRPVPQRAATSHDRPSCNVHEHAGHFRLILLR
jgi:uncharacterized protein YjdB